MTKTPKLLNKQVGKYQIMNEINRGGMGIIFLGKHITLNRYAAVKMLFPHLASETNFVKRFRKEMNAMSKLKHQNIVDIYDYEEAHSTYFIIMEVVVGRSLEAMLNELSVLTQEDAIEIIIQVLQALGYAHDNGVLHRDIKPSNIMINEQGLVKVLDFGIAKIIGGEDLTQTGFMVGTPQYICPEQAKGGELSAASDIYSVSSVLYEMVTGRPPFEAESPVALALAHIKQSPEKPRKINSNISSSLEKVILKGMLKDPSKRFKSADEMIAALENIHAPVSKTNKDKNASVKRLVDQVSPTVSKDDLARLSDDSSKDDTMASESISESWVKAQQAGFVFRLKQIIENLKNLNTARVVAIIIIIVLISGAIGLGTSKQGQRILKDSWMSISMLFQTSASKIVNGSDEMSGSENLIFPINPNTPKSYGNVLGMKFEIVPGGKFDMGEKPGATGSLDDSPVHEVVYDTYLICQYEITNEHYQMFIRDTGYPAPPNWEEQQYPDGQHPVTNVNWYDAQIFCKWLSKKTGLFFRLPTEAEWERAAYSAGRYPWGDRWNAKSANVLEAGYNKSLPVGSYSKDQTLLLIHDMGGNVREWVSDYYSMSEYAELRGKNPKGPLNGKKRVVRGGGFDIPYNESRSTRRSSLNPRTKKNNLGFRIVLQENMASNL